MFAWTRSVRGKVILVVLATTLIALLVAAGALLIYESQSYRQSAMADLTTQADILARASAPALAFDDAESARANLGMMRVRPNIAAAALYANDGTLFASYRRPDAPQTTIPPAPAPDGIRIAGGRIELFQPVIENHERLGTVHLSASYDLAQRVEAYAAILAAVLFASLAIALLVSTVLQAAITRPIVAITDVARQVMERRDFSLRVRRTTRDEIGYLVDAFNAMLLEVGRRAEALEISNRSLESEIAERRAAEEALRAADRRKDEFLATLAHELRNPLAPLRNGIEILKLPNRAPAAAERTREMMERQLAQMVRLVDDLLDVSRVSTGKLTLRREPVLLRSIVESAVETASPYIQSRKHTLTVTMPPQPITLDADATRLAQVFSNLLNNAAKYTEPGGRIVFDVASDGSTVTVRVVDSGIGIEHGMLTTIFELFAQADHSLERAHVGLGVGLTLAKRLTELHGGTLEARSAGLGKGSEFVVRLPLAPASGAARAAAADAAASGPTSGHRILIVDDNRDFAASLATLLQGLGNEVRVANDGLAGLDAAQEFLPQLALLDIGMPKLNGYELAERLRRIPALAGTYLVAITGWGQEKDRTRAFAAGFDRHLVKPANRDDIVAILRGLPRAATH